MISLGADVLQALDRSAALEWLVTDGHGGFAMGTAAGMNTRRYHGWCVSLKPPVERYVLLSRVEESVAGVEFATNQYPGAVHPEGYRRLVKFDREPSPTWTWKLEGGLTVTKQLWLSEGSLVIRYGASAPCELKVRPMIAFRDYHALQHANGALDASWLSEPGAIVTKPYEGLPAMRIAFGEGGVATHDGDGWYYATEYREEQRRGLDFHEDLWCLGTISLPLMTDAQLVFSVDAPTTKATERSDTPKRSRTEAETLAGLRTRLGLADLAEVTVEHIVRDFAQMQEKANERIREIEAATLQKDPTLAKVARDFELTRERVRQIEAEALRKLRFRHEGPQLQAAADQFRVTRADGRPTIVAGYPWFTDWGRDTMISIRGLLISRGLLDEAREVMRAFLEHLDQGLIPNRFPDRGERPEYNTSDATLWMFEAAQALLDAGGDERFIRESFFDRAREIVSWHERGTHFELHVDPADGLLVSGPQTTWMDAVVYGQPVTPRAGKAVEINALWLNALRLVEGWARRFGRSDVADDFHAKAQRTAGAFRRAFWNAGAGCLLDVVGDARVRPNQVFAASLTHTTLSTAELQSVMRVVESRLLTPVGLRTLAQGEDGYVGRYEGDPASRDRAYHQGTVWPWLIGPYVDGMLAAFGKPATPKCQAALAPLLRLLDENGTLPEVFDGDAPHRAGGTPAQAWSVAEVLRAQSRVG